MSNDFLILVPAYNAASTLASLVDKIRKQAVSARCDILVVNDGSGDRTAEVAKSKGVAVITHANNAGKGEALKTGFRFAIENEYPAIVTMDADLQHDPESLSSLIRHFSEGRYEIVIGSRHFDRTKMSFARILSNTLTSYLLSLRTGFRIPDSQSGYRIMKTDVLKRIRLTTSGYETESEILIRAGKNKFRIGFVPIETIYAAEKSHIRHLRDTFRFIKMYLKTLFD